MDFIVFVVRLALAGFVLWGAWLCLSCWIRGDSRTAPARDAQADGFERVASLVLLALLCTTMAGIA